MTEQNMAEGVADQTLESVAHTLAHVVVGGARTDHCPRDFVASSERGVEGQVRHLIGFVLTDDEREAVADYLDLLPRPEGTGGAAILHCLATDDDAIGFVADAIEGTTPYYWEDGDVFRHVDCEMIDEYGDFNLGEDDLSIEALRDENGDVAHLRVCWTLGGPNVWLIRDWGEDRIEVYWGGKATRYGRDVTELLDAYTELLSY